MRVSVLRSSSRRSTSGLAVRGMIAGAALCLASLVAQAAPPPDRQEPRTVVIDLADLARGMDALSAKAGETVRFVLHNSGDVMHDFTIGTAARQEGRKALIAVLTDGEPLGGENGGYIALDTPNAVLVMPGEIKELTWTFTETADVQFGNNLPARLGGGVRGAFKFENIDPHAHPKTIAHSGSKLANAPPDNQPVAYQPNLGLSDKRLEVPAADKVVRPDPKLTLAVPPPFPKEKPALAKPRAVTLITPPAFPRTKPFNARSNPARPAPDIQNGKPAAKVARKKKKQKRLDPQVVRTKNDGVCRQTVLPAGSENIITSIYVCD